MRAIYLDSSVWYIALMSHIGKLMMIILTRRLQGQVEEHLADEQASYRKERSTIQQTLALRPIAEKEKGKVEQSTTHGLPKRL